MSDIKNSLFKLMDKGNIKQWNKQSMYNYFLIYEPKQEIDGRFNTIMQNIY